MGAGLVAFLVVVVVLFWGGVFMVVFSAGGTTMFEFFFGRCEPLPDDLGTWKASVSDAETGVLREERWLLPEGRTEAGYLLQQVRYRDRATGAILRMEPERRVRRRRLSVRASR